MTTCASCGAPGMRSAINGVTHAMLRQSKLLERHALAAGSGVEDVGLSALHEQSRVEASPVCFPCALAAEDEGYTVEVWL